MQNLVSASHSLLSNASRTLLSKLRPPSTRTRCKDGAQPLAPSDRDDAVLSLCGLPHDVLLLILGFLDARTLLICKGVSRLFRNLIATDVLLTYRIELAINGMIDGPLSSGLAIPERLDRLRQYSERSCTGQFTLDTEVKLGRIGLGDFAHFMAPWDFRNLQTDSFGGTVCFELMAGGERSLVVYAPPSVIEGTPARHWTIPLPPTGKRILAVDETQDLVVAIAPVLGVPRKAEFSLSSLESGGTALHPLAEEPTWEITFDGHPALEVMDIQIFGPYIAWKTPIPNDYGVVKDHLQVRNWKTGRKVWDDHMRQISSFTFIDTSYLIAIFCSVFDSFPGRPGRRPDLIGIYRIQEGQLPVGHVATLQLPQGMTLSTILNPSVPCPPTPPPSAAFWPDPERRIVVLRLMASYSRFHTMMRMLQSNSSYWTWHYTLLIIPCTTFHKHIKLAGSPQNSTPPLPSVPWEDWGPRGSVLIRQDNFDSIPHQTANWLPPFVFPYGSRLTFFAPSSGGARLVTLDVNPFAKLHPPHPGCTRRDALASAEKSSDRGLSSVLKTTTHPRAYYLGPSFPDFQQAFGISQNASGYVVFPRPGGFLRVLCFVTKLAPRELYNSLRVAEYIGSLAGGTEGVAASGGEESSQLYRAGGLEALSANGLHEVSEGQVEIGCGVGIYSGYE